MKGFYSFRDIDASQGIVIKNGDHGKFFNNLTDTDPNKLNGYVITGNDYIKYVKADEGDYFFAGDNKDYDSTYNTWLTLLFNTGNSNSLNYIYKFNGNLSRKLIPTEIPAPTKTVTDTDETSVSNTLKSHGDEFTYNITYLVPAEGKEFYYTKYQLTDTLPNEVEVTSKGVEVFDEYGKDCKAYFDIKVNGNTVTITARDNDASQKDYYGKNSSGFYDKIYTFKINVKIKEAEYNKHAIGTMSFKNKANISIIQPRYNLDKAKNDIDSAQETTPYSVTFETNEVNTQLQIGQIKVIKQNSVTGAGVAGARIGIYSNIDCSHLVKEVRTGADGTILSGNLDTGIYYVKEIEAPANYVKDDTVHTVEVINGQTAEVAIQNAPYGQIQIIKRDSVNTGTNLANAVFSIYNDSSCSSPVQENLRTGRWNNNINTISTRSNILCKRNRSTSKLCKRQQCTSSNSTSRDNSISNGR